MRVRVENRNWKHANGVYVRGQGFVNNEFYKAEALVDYFSKAHNEEELKECLSQVNGHFALIINTPSLHAAAIDITRIYPLFYANVRGEWFITDNAMAIADYGTQFDNLALAQYKCSGSTFAGRTLVQGMQQMMPGYYLLFQQSLIHQKSFKAYASAFQANPTFSFSDYQKQLDQVLERAFQRLIISSEGRQLVVALSGGYDSRLLLTFLYRLEYKNVLCYTIGRKQSPECIRAQKVAQQLGYKIIRIDNEEFLQKENPVRSLLFREYYRYMGSYTNFMWLFELPALLSLTAQGQVEPNAIFVPGHSADFLSGSQLEKAQIGPSASPKKMAKIMITDNFPYGLPTKHGVYDEIFAYLNRSIFQGVPSYIAFNDFLMRNHIVPQINNAARIYDFFGKDVRLPFWDDEVISFFFHLPYACLRGRKLYRSYVHALFLRYHIDFYQDELSTWVYQVQRIKNRIKNAFPSLCKKYYQVRKGKGADTSTAEWQLAQPLLEEMQKKNPNYAPASVNHLMKDWYLRKVSEEFKNHS